MQGWCELGTFVKDTLDLHLPMTCRDATRFDTFLLPPCLLQHVATASVLRVPYLASTGLPRGALDVEIALLLDLLRA